jgi:hypothetical protein
VKEDKKISENNKAELYKMYAQAMKIMPGSPKQKALIKKIDALRKKLDMNEERDYKAEYKKFQSSTKSKKYRAELNKYNRKKGTYGNGDGKDASHKGGKIVGFESQSKNRGRAEKSRLKKESSPMSMIKLKDLVVEEKKMGTSHFMKMSIAARRIEKEVNKLVKDWRKHGGPKHDGGPPERLNKSIEDLRKAASDVEATFDYIGKDPDDYVTNITKDFIK